MVSFSMNSQSNNRNLIRGLQSYTVSESRRGSPEVSVMNERRRTDKVLTDGNSLF